MKLNLAATLVACVFLCGCADTASETPESTAATPPAGETGTGFAITSENTTITFIGSHAGDKPDPRTCNFTDVSGSIAVADNTISGVEIEIKTAEITTFDEKLTQHLKGADFFSVREHPTANFKSTSVAAGEDGQITITGTLTLLGTSQEVSFPATATASGEDVSLQAEFDIDRTQFGMTFKTDTIESIVNIKVAVGK